MTGKWQQSFGAGTVNPAALSYEEVDMAANTALIWPLESSGANPSVAFALNVIPAVANLSLAMPDATQGAPGVVSFIRNGGNTAFTLTDFYNNQLVVINPGIVWMIWLIDNGTPMGQWLVIQMGASTSAADAGALAGPGLQAVGSLLRTNIVTAEFNTSQFIDATYRAKAIVWQGSTAGGFHLDTITNLGVGWYAFFSNTGTGAVAITTSGSDTINGVSQATVPAGAAGAPYSCLVVAAGDGFYTFAATPSIIPIDGGGTGADNAEDALVNLGGTAIGIAIFTAPDSAAVLALLNIRSSALLETNIVGNQILTPSNSGYAFTCEAALQLTLPDTSTLTPEYLFAVYAQGGAVTLAPQGTDRINGGTLGATFVMPLGASLMMLTDGATNWWPYFYSAGAGGGGGGGGSAAQWTVATGTGDAIIAAYTPAITALTDGLALSFRAVGANTITTPTINVNGLGAKVIVKNGNTPLAPGDIPGANAEVSLRYNLALNAFEIYNPAINLDLVGNVRGDLLARGTSEWVPLPIGFDGQYLRSNGTDPIYDYGLPGAQTVIAAASTVDLGTSGTNNVLVNGASTINLFGASATASQPIYFVEFNAACTLVNSAALILPGGVNISTAAGDAAIAEYLGAGNWRVRQYTVAATGQGPGYIPPGAGVVPIQGISFTTSGGVITVINSFGGISLTRTGLGTYNLTLGAPPLTMKFLLSQACAAGSGDTVGLGGPTTGLAPSTTYAIAFHFASSKSVVDPDVGMILVY